MPETMTGYPTGGKEGGQRFRNMYEAASAGNVEDMTEILLSGSNIEDRDA